MDERLVVVLEPLRAWLCWLGGLTESIGLQGCLLSLFALCCIGLILWSRTQWTCQQHSLSPQEWNELLDLTKTAYLCENKTKVLSLLEGQPLDVNEYRDPITGLNLLLCACLSGQLDLVTLLLDKGADPSAITSFGHSSLCLATYVCITLKNTNIKLIDLLACRGVNVNHLDKGGNTALSVAALYGRADITSILLQYGADPAVCGASNVRPFDLAEDAGNRAVARLMEIHKKKTND